MKAWRKIAAVALLLGLCVAVGCCREKPEKILRADSKDLKHTIITAHLEEKIVPGKNLIYCSTFQLAWNELRDDIVKEDVRLEGNPPLAEFLNKKLATKDDLSEDSYVAMAGFARDGAVKKINSALKSKFGGEAPRVEGQFGPQDIIAYGFLLKELKFKTPFESLKKPLEFRTGSVTTKVEAFGIKEFRPQKPPHAKLAKQFSIIESSDSDDEVLAVKLLPKSPKDEIVLAHLKPRETLLETVRRVEKVIRGGEPRSLSGRSTLQIPTFDFDLRHRYAELVGKNLLNADLVGYYLAEARQGIRFQLNERGATLRSWALLGVKSELRPIFNSPFLLYLKEKQAKYPYLAIWVAHPEILMKK